MKRLGMLCALLALTLNAGAQAPNPLIDGFTNPPDSARPWVYWFWLSGNITREGITADLEAMKRVGIGGVLIMEVDQGVPYGPVDFMSPEWRDLFKHVVSEAQRLGLEVNMNNDAGWNGSGGPWIKPEQSMQTVVWTETPIEGPQHFEGALPQPEAVAGYYRDIVVQAIPATELYPIDNVRTKTGYRVGGVAPASEAAVPPDKTVPQETIVELTAQMDAAGKLVWDVPAGKWTVLRFGHTSTGIENAPAPKSGRGLECDKLSKEGIEANFAGMMGPLIEDNASFAGKALVATHIDSWENGAQNWTLRMREEFKGRRGYDPLSYLPALTSRVIGSLELTERFLWDLRRTVSDLIVENYAGRLRELAQERGLRLSIEAYGGPCDNLPYAGRADEPMCEFWIGGNALSTCKEQSSAAHTYGKPIVGAESFTANDSERWQEFPGSIKALGDQAFCDGVNRFVFHRYALQPWADRRPGMTMGPWGIHYERTQTWWDMTPAWHEYLSRCQFMLRQGLFVADICYLESEQSPQGYGGRDRKGYDFDDCSAEVVLTRMSVKDGRLTLPDGMSYRVMVLPGDGFMTPALLEKITELVRAGATVIGPPFRKSPSLQGYPDCDARVQQLAGELWADCDGEAVKEHRFGEGRVVWGMTPEGFLADEGVAPDFRSRSRLGYIHRKSGDTDFYFVANPNAHAVREACTFRMTGRRPELWWPDTGRTEPAAVVADDGAATRVWLSLEPSDSVFVVFREDAQPAGGIAVLTRDGNTVLSTGETKPAITVIQATYGIPGDPQKTRDVRDVLQKLVDAGVYDIHAARIAETGDPAVNEQKTLSVEYRIGEKMYTVKGADADTLRLSEDAVGVSVEKAVYGVPGDPQRTRDVRSRLQRILDTGESAVKVARMAEGDDPAFGVVKTLTVEYSVAGRRLTAKGTDSDTISFVPPPAADEQVVYARGETFEALKPGLYEWSTTSGQTGSAEVRDVPAPVALEGPWKVTFGPNEQNFEKLESWSEHGNAAVRYFSGTARYEKEVTVPDTFLAENRRQYLDLGSVKVMARVKLNGRDMGVLWKGPYCVDVTGIAKAGSNQLVIEVANQWINRMIGDEQLPEDSSRAPEGNLIEWPQWITDGQPSPAGRETFTTWRLWKKDSPLQESGLIGPVKLYATEVLHLSR